MCNEEVLLCLIFPENQRNYISKFSGYVKKKKEKKNSYHQMYLVCGSVFSIGLKFSTLLNIIEWQFFCHAKRIIYDYCDM